MKGNYFTYITTNPNKSVLYVGMTNDLYSRMLQHYENKGQKTSFAGKYYCYLLIYYERFPTAIMAIEREKEMKNMSRKQKEELIREMNPMWRRLMV